MFLFVGTLVNEEVDDGFTGCGKEGRGFLCMEG